MVLCPIAVAVGCKRCPAFSVCPLKTVIGDYRPDADVEASADTKPQKKASATPKRPAYRQGARARRPRK